MTNLKTFSVLLAWQDNDPEQGEFGCTVRATGYEDAEAKARQKMRDCYAEQYDQEMDGDGGRVIELSEGAIWAARDLEKALRALLDQCDDIANRQGGPDNLPRNYARAVLDRIENGE